jgi:hypothetical protein
MSRLQRGAPDECCQDSGNGAYRWRRAPDFSEKEDAAPASELPKRSWQRFRFIRRSAKRSEGGRQQPQFNRWIRTAGEKTRKGESDMEDQKSGGKFLSTREKDVEFVFRSPNAKKVYLAGEFNSWDAESLPMKNYTEGAWEAMLKLPPGRYEYKMYVDDAWTEESLCTVMMEGRSFKMILEGGRIPNPFGTQNYFVWVK